MVRMAATASLCIIVGVLHPLATESSKTAAVIECSRTEVGLTCTADEPAAALRMAMPYHGITLTLAAELVSVIIAFSVVAYSEGSVQAGLRRLLSRKAILQLLPVGAVYGLGDFLQTQATNAASAPVVLVVGQTKLLLSAVLSKLVLQQNEPTNWLGLITISAAAIASTDISANGAAARGLEVYGASLAFAKAFLSSSGAVLSESLYKSGDGDFWVVSFRVQLLMLMTTLSLLPITSGDMSLLFSPTEFFTGGPTVCQKFDAQMICDPGSMPFATCSCTDRSGWDIMTVFAVLAIVANGVTTGLTLQILSAVSKAVCNSLSACVLYIAYVLYGFRPFNLAQAMVLLIVSIGSFEYASEKAKRKTMKQKPAQSEGWEKGYP